MRIGTGIYAALKTKYDRRDEKRRGLIGTHRRLES